MCGLDRCLSVARFVESRNGPEVGGSARRGSAWGRDHWCLAGAAVVVAVVLAWVGVEPRALALPPLGVHKAMADLVATVVVVGCLCAHAIGSELKRCRQRHWCSRTYSNAGSECHCSCEVGSSHHRVKGAVGGVEWSVEPRQRCWDGASVVVGGMVVWWIGVGCGLIVLGF